MYVYITVDVRLGENIWVVEMFVSVSCVGAVHVGGCWGG